MRPVYEGKSKLVYEVSDDELLMVFKDDVTAMDGLYKSSVRGKGAINARVSVFFFELLEKNGIKTHYLSYDGFTSMRVRRLKMIPLEVVVRNYAYGSLLKRLPLFPQMQKLEKPLIEFHYKSDELHDPLVLEDDIILAGLLSPEELAFIKEASLKVNQIMSETFREKGLTLLDLKVEFGRDKGNRLLLADEITGDTFRVLDENGSHLDKEVFRRTRDVDAMMRAYVELAKKLGIRVDDIVSG